MTNIRYKPLIQIENIYSLLQYRFFLQIRKFNCMLLLDVIKINYL